MKNVCKLIPLLTLLLLLTACAGLPARKGGEDGRIIYEETVLSVQVFDTIQALKGYAVVGYTGGTPLLKVPAEHRGLPVLEIRALPKGVTAISIPKTVRRISVEALRACPTLKSLTVDPENEHYGAGGGCLWTLPSGMLVYGANGCRIPEDATLRSIGSRALAGCAPAMPFRIPENIRMLAEDAFEGCLTDLTESDASGTYVDTWLIGSDSSAEVLTLREGTVGIAPSALCGKTALTELVLPTSLRYIDSLALSGCSSLSKICLPQGLRRIGADAFSDCIALREIILPDSLDELGYRAFARCSALQEICLPPLITAVPDRAFSECRSLRTVALSPDTARIGAEAFYNCIELRCVSLSEPTVAPLALSPIMYYINVMIDDRAFGNCVSLTELTVPHRVRAIHSTALWNCISLTELTLFYPEEWAPYKDYYGAVLGEPDPALLRDPSAAAALFTDPEIGYANAVWCRPNR